MASIFFFYELFETHNKMQNYKMWILIIIWYIIHNTQTNRAMNAAYEWIDIISRRVDKY